MKQNMGTGDRIIRVVLGISALLMSVFLTSGVWDIVLYILAAILLLTAIIGVCPAYMPFHLSTRKN